MRLKSSVSSNVSSANTMRALNVFVSNAVNECIRLQNTARILRLYISKKLHKHTHIHTYTVKEALFSDFDIFLQPASFSNLRALTNIRASMCGAKTLIHWKTLGWRLLDSVYVFIITLSNHYHFRLRLIKTPTHAFFLASPQYSMGKYV